MKKTLTTPKTKAEKTENCESIVNNLNYGQASKIIKEIHKICNENENTKKYRYIMIKDEYKNVYSVLKVKVS